MTDELKEGNWRLLEKTGMDDQWTPVLFENGTTDLIPGCPMTQQAAGKWVGDFNTKYPDKDFMVDYVPPK